MKEFLKTAPKNLNLNRIVGLDFPDEKLVLPGEIGLVLEWRVKDPNGRLVLPRSGKKRGESFVQQFIQMLYIQMNGIGNNFGYPVADVNNFRLEMCVSAKNWDTVAATATTTYGILVGTGNTAPTLTDYCIESLIAHGTGAGQVQYGGMTYGLPTATAAVSSFTLVRSFANNSGGDITVNEAAVYARCYNSMQDNSPYYFYLMLLRDVIAGGILLLDGETLTLNYRYQAAI